MILKSPIIWCFLILVRAEFTHTQNYIKIKRQDDVVQSDARSLREHECQCSQAQTSLAVLTTTCRLCASSNLAKALSMKFAWDGQVVAFWKTNDPNGCVLENFGKSHFTNITCKQHSQSNLVVLTLWLEPVDLKFNYYIDEWMCGGQGDDTGSHTKYFSKWSESQVCYPDDGLHYRQKSLGTDDGASPNQTQDVQISLPQCVRCVSCLRGDKGNTSLHLNISCRTEIVEYCLIQPQSTSYCCYQGMANMPGVFQNCYGPRIKGPNVTQIHINYTALIKSETMQLQLILINGNTGNLSCVCNTSSALDSNGTVQTSDNTGVIIGGVIGCIAFITIIVGAIVCYNQWKHKKRQNNGDQRYEMVNKRRMVQS